MTRPNSGVISMDIRWLAELTIVLGFCGTVFNYIVIRPLNVSIQRLGDVIAELREDLKLNNERLNKLEAEVRVINHSLQNAHERIDAISRKKATRLEKS